MTRRYPLVAREAWLAVVVLILLAVGLNRFMGLLPAILSGLLALLVVLLFRDPPRKIPPKPLDIVAPVDSRVVAVEPVNNPYIDGQSVRFELLMGFTDVYTVRSPIEGKVMKQWWPNKQDNSNTPQDRFAQWVQTDEQDDVVMTFKPTTVLRRPHCYVHSGERVGQGQRCGIVPFGAIVEVYVPHGSKLLLKQGDVVKAGSETLAVLVH